MPFNRPRNGRELISGGAEKGDPAANGNISGPKVPFAPCGRKQKEYSIRQMILCHLARGSLQ